MLAEGHKMPKEVIEADVIVIEMLSWSCLHVPIMITVICDFHVNCNWKSDGLIQIEQITMAACHGVGYIYLGILPTLECCFKCKFGRKTSPWECMGDSTSWSRTCSWTSWFRPSVATTCSCPACCLWLFQAT